MNRPDIQDLSNLLDQLRERHALVFYFICVMTALGVMGLLCLFDTLFPVKVQERMNMEKSISDTSATVKHTPRYSEKTALRKPRWYSEETALTQRDSSKDENSKTEGGIRVAAFVK